jgi:hypothetical protein
MTSKINTYHEDAKQQEIHTDLLSKFLKRPKTLKAIRGDICLPEFRDEMFTEFLSYDEITIQQQTVKVISKITAVEANNSNLGANNVESSANTNIVIEKVEQREESKYIEVHQEIESNYFFNPSAKKKNVPKKPHNIDDNKTVSSVLRDDFIYCETKLHPNSFLTGCSGKNLHMKNGKLETPSPYFIEVDRFQTKPKLDKQSILEGMIVNDKTGLVLVDQNIMIKFKGIIGNMISQLISSFFTGKPISLLVRLFEPKSTLQRIMDYWSFAPTFLKEAVKIESPVERMKKVITFAIAGLYVPTKQLKPFNPNIGETFQGEFENGSQLYAEHVSHYPTLAQFYIKDPDFNIHGYFDFQTNSESLGSKIRIDQKGPIHIDFNNGQQIIYNMPVIKLLNARGEENRSAIWIDHMIFADTKNNLKGIVHLGAESKHIHGVTGHIIEFNFPKDYKFDIDKERKDSAKISKTTKVLSTISGSWLKDLKFDGQEYWNIDKYEPSFVKPCTNVLPSDGRYREDLIWLFRSFYDAKNEEEKKKFEDYAQSWKLLIEQIQRHERDMKKKARNKKK